MSDTDIAPGHKQGSTPVVTNLANTRLAVWDLATVPAGKTAHPVAVELFVQFALTNFFMNDFVECTHMCVRRTERRHGARDFLRRSPVAMSNSCAPVLASYSAINSFT